MCTENGSLRKRSGEVDSSDPVVAFLYILMRDHLSPGKVEKVVLEHCSGGKHIFTNGWLAEYAKDIAIRLKT